MKPRHPTPEERTLWRQSNRFTQGVKEEDSRVDNAAFAEEALHDGAQSPSPLRGEVGRGPESGTASPHNGLTPTLPLRGRELHILPARAAAKRFKSYPVEATLDLHGYSKIEAYIAVARFLTRCHAQGKRHVTLITGKGRPEEGVLKRELPRWLNEPVNRPHISAFGHARPERGGAGVMHVLLKK